MATFKELMDLQRRFKPLLELLQSQHDYLLQSGWCNRTPMAKNPFDRGTYERYDGDSMELNAAVKEQMRVDLHLLGSTAILEVEKGDIQKGETVRFKTEKKTPENP